MKAARHLVLTVKSTDCALRQQLASLRAWFAKLRRTRVWRDRVVSGVYTIEVTINERTGLWHPHIHCVFDGLYLPWKLLQRTWHDITDGSDIIWIEPVHNAPGMAAELCKYIGKPQDAANWTDLQIRTYALSTHGSRMVQSFGRTRPAPIVDTDPRAAPPVNTWHISLHKVLWLADMQQEAAYAALPLIAELYPHLGRYIYARMPQLEPDGTRAARLKRIMTIIETGRAPPRHAPPSSRDPAIIHAQLVPILTTLHNINEAELPWH
jgi:hypothetical protein